MPQVIESFVDSLSTHEDPLALLDSLHDLFVKAAGIRSCQTVLQTFRGDRYRLHRSHPAPTNGKVYEWKAELAMFRWYDATYVDHLYLEGPTQREGERQLAEMVRRSFQDFRPTLCFPIMSGVEQIGVLLLGEDFEISGLPSQLLERIYSLLKRVNLAMTRLGILEDMQTTGRLPRGLAHDFQGLLTPIASFIQLAEEGNFGNEGLRELAPMASRNLHAMQDYIRAARPSAKGVSPEFRSARLEDVMAKAFELAAPIYESKHVALEMVEGDVGAQLQMDEALMVRLLMNLLTNALAASAPGSRVVVELLRLRRSSSAGTWYRFRVSDRGRGFSQARLSQLLSTPFGLRDAGRSETGGFGIGLSICRRIVRMHGGHMQIASSEGQGTVVEIDFPQKEYL